MSNAESDRNAGRSSTIWFTLAFAFLILGGMSNPLFLAIALAFIAVAVTQRRGKQDIIHAVVLLALVAVAFAYGLGKDLAKRDNALSNSSSVDGA